jgi:hypothetical protein
VVTVSVYKVSATQVPSGCGDGYWLGHGSVELKRWLKKFDEVRDRDEAKKTGELWLQSSRNLLPHWDSDILKAPPRICTAC